MIFVVITTETISGRDSRTADLLPTLGEAREFMKSQHETYSGSKPLRMELHRLDGNSLAMTMATQGPTMRARKRGCRRGRKS